eukprot:10077959-Ditylum_brightwellii.AAC.1
MQSTCNHGWSPCQLSLYHHEINSCPCPLHYAKGVSEDRGGIVTRCHHHVITRQLDIEDLSNMGKIFFYH